MYLCMYVLQYKWPSLSAEYDLDQHQPGIWLPNPAHGQLNMENIFFHCLRLRLRIWSRETGLAVLSRVSLLILHTQTEPGAYLRDSSCFPRRRHSPLVYLNRHMPSSRSRIYQVTQLRTDGVHCRESAETRPVVLKVVSVTGVALAAHHEPNNMRISFPHPLLVCIIVEMLTC